jgi:hypothetical protein
VTSSGERQADPSLAQALHAINGETLNKKLMSPEGTIGRMLAQGADDDAVLRTLYLSALSREPTAEERKSILAALGGDGAASSPENRRVALEDVAWALLTSKEFVFNH